MFPRIVSSLRIDWGEVGGFGVETRAIGALPIAGQVRELQAALSVNKSELARILRVSRPTVYDWLDCGEPTADNRSRIRMLLRLVSSGPGPKAGTPDRCRPATSSGGRSPVEVTGQSITGKDIDDDGRPWTRHPIGPPGVEAL